MSDIRLSQLTSLSTPASGDLLFINDVSDTTQSASGSSKSITVSDLLQDYATQADLTTISGDLTTHISDTTTHGTTGDIVGTSDIQTLTNKTLTSPKINSLVATSATSEELNTLDGFSGSVDDLNYSKDLRATGVTSTEFDSLDGITAIASELNITDGGQTTEKVLNVQCKCSAYLNVAQNNTATGNNVKVLLDAEEYDMGGDFDTANSRFVAPVDGYYLVCVGVSFISLVANKRYSASIYVNSVQVANSMISIGTDTTGVKPTVSKIVYAQAGQYIELYSFHNDGVSTSDITTGISNTFMTIHLLSI